MSSNSDIAGIAAIGVVGYILLRKIETTTKGAGEAVSTIVENVEKNYVETIETTKKEVSQTVKSVEDNAVQWLKDTSPAYQIVKDTSTAYDKLLDSYDKLLDSYEKLKSGSTGNSNASGGGGGGARGFSGATPGSTPGISKTYGTGDKVYDKYVNDLTATWETNLAANKSINLAAKAKTQNSSSSTAGKTSSTKSAGTDVHGRSPAKDRYKKK